MFFRKNNNITSIQKYSDLDTKDTSYFLLERIKQLDILITEANKNILQAQTVRLRAFFDQRQSIFKGFQRRFVESKASNSVIWHQNRLAEMLSERRSLQDKLDKLNGKYWSKKITKYLSFLLFIAFGVLAFSTIIAGIFAALYLLPFFIFFGFIFYVLRNFFSVKYR